MPLAFELRNPVFQPPRPLQKFIRIPKPRVDRTSPIVKPPQHFRLRIANRFGKLISHLLNGVGEILFCGWLTLHIQLRTTNNSDMG
jgi:hypothetical protein